MKNFQSFAVGIIVGVAVCNYLCKEQPKPHKKPCLKEIEVDCCESPKKRKKCYYQRYYR